MDIAENMFVFNIGGYSENTEFTIIKNHEALINSDKDKCKHASKTIVKKCKRYDGYEYEELYCTIPNVVKSINQGGYDCTFVCVDCIIEAIDKIKGGE